jgi:hypothetical protein
MKYQDMRPYQRYRYHQRRCITAILALIAVTVLVMYLISRG